MEKVTYELNNFAEKSISQQEIVASINLANAIQPERTVILLQVLYAINERNWETAYELTYQYGSHLTENNIVGRQLFISLILFLNQNGTTKPKLEISC